MHEEANKTLMRTVMRAYGKGDLQPLFDALDENVVWTANAPVTHFRFGGGHKGRAGVKEYTALMFSRYSATSMEPKSIAAQDDMVWGIFDVIATHIPSGKPVRADLSVHWIVRDGRIMAHQGFFDTAAVLMQQGDLVA